MEELVASMVVWALEEGVGPRELEAPTELLAALLSL
jgi:hypothetical protein